MLFINTILVPFSIPTDNDEDSIYHGLKYFLQSVYISRPPPPPQGTYPVFFTTFQFLPVTENYRLNANEMTQLQTWFVF